MFWAFSLIKANLYSKKFCFSIEAFVLYLHEVFSIIVIIVPLFKGNACINLEDYQFVERLHSLVSWLLQGIEKRIETLKGFLT